ncbi:hypothetical protein [Flavobacterium sp. '19STA2R22 D10 B1']|uniref:hypothetical protein n=1 Tax=Flavobacterium aerium TaxID=3037261 RepID=UPI00278C4A71|nr:hypothetical protein [Flavobacterium sp. '19STA2R22 D10 B1']
MNSKESINERFKEAIYHIIATEKDENKSAIASKLKIGKSKLSEILNKRMNIGVDLVADLSDIYSIDSEWILTGRGTMKGGYVSDQDNNHKVNEIFENDLERIIRAKYEMIETLKSQIEDLKRDKEVLLSLLNNFIDRKEL